MSQTSNSLSLFVSHRGALVAYANGITQDPGLAEDVVQEAYLRFSHAMGERSLGEPLGYLYRIVRNLAFDSMRAHQRERQVFPPQDERAPSDAIDETPSPEAQAVARDDLQRLALAMAELPERTRLALEMRRFSGHKFKDIASHLGVSISVAHELVAEGVAHCHRRVHGQRSRG